MPDTMTTALPVTLSDIEAAARVLEGQIVHTPMHHSRTLSAITGAEVWVKFENLQFTAAFKERGALNHLLQMGDNSRARGVIAASAGNHSQGLSYHGSRLGVPVTIVMPEMTPAVKVQRTQRLGGNVVLFGSNYDEAYDHAVQLAEERGLELVHPFDNRSVAAGQGTVALEMIEDKDDFEDDDGCPDTDNDGDRREDSVDQCPNKKEDIDGFQDDDGCPELDNDKDGLANANDDCPDEAGPANTNQARSADHGDRTRAAKRGPVMGMLNKEIELKAGQENREIPVRLIRN